MCLFTFIFMLSYNKLNNKNKKKQKKNSLIKKKMEAKQKVLFNA